MIKKLIPFMLVLVGALMIACEPNNPFDRGPLYDEEANLKIDSAKIVAFLDTAQIDSIYRIYDPSGVVIIVQEEGVGTRPITNTAVYTDYTGYLLDGTVFDTSIESVAIAEDIVRENAVYTPFQFFVNSSPVIQGWNIGFQRLRPGSKAVFVIPSVWGYQNVEQNRIPENSVLIFNIDFLGID